jgi:hypothetical protein
VGLAQRLVHTSVQCLWNVCGTYICNEKKETTKICGMFLDVALVHQWSSAWKQLSLQVKCRGWSGFQIFVQGDEK